MTADAEAGARGVATKTSNGCPLRQDDQRQRNSLITLNVGDDDFVGNVVSGSSFNAIGNGSRIFGVQHGVNGNQIGTATQLLNFNMGALANNGGPTLTHALIEGSLAIDAGNGANAPPFDQRGILRPLQSPSDVGAFEAQRILSVTLPAGGGNYRLSKDGSDLLLKADAGATVFRYEYAALATLAINASGGGDGLVVDFASGPAVPIRGVTFVAASVNDSLVVRGRSAATVTHTVAGIGTGSLSIDGELVAYQNVRPVTDEIAAVNRVLRLSTADDTISIGKASVAGRNRVAHGTASVTFTNPSGSLLIDAGAGNDAVTLAELDPGLTVALAIDGGAGNDTLNAAAAGRSVIINGSDGQDVITGSLLSDLLSGGLGDDSIYGQDGNDTVSGDAGQDWIFGDGGDDVLSGGDGDDMLFGGSGSDSANSRRSLGLRPESNQSLRSPPSR